MNASLWRIGFRYPSIRKHSAYVVIPGSLFSLVRFPPLLLQLLFQYSSTGVCLSLEVAQKHTDTALVSSLHKLNVGENAMMLGILMMCLKLYHQHHFTLKNQQFQLGMSDYWPTIKIGRYIFNQGDTVIYYVFQLEREHFQENLWDLFTFS